MERREHEALLNCAYEAVLGRLPAPDSEEYKFWIGRLERGVQASDLIRALLNSPEGRRRRGVNLYVPPGHFYSPVVDPSSVHDYVALERKRGADNLRGILIDIDAMRQRHLGWASVAGEVHVPEEAGAPERFSMASTTQFPFGDAWALKAIIRDLHPRRIIEVGSGSTTACMLDALDAFGFDDCVVTCIEPYPDVLRKFLRPDDTERVTIIESPVQSVAPDLFATLEAGDILFIDSTHVMKTGSDLHFLFFQALPMLRPGVFIHFHDCMFPFEYVPHWIFEKNYSWNEIYVLRAFLTHNPAYRIIYWSSMLAALYALEMDSVTDGLSKRPGSGIWIEKIVDTTAV